MAEADLDRLLRWYPPAWRERYGEEFVVCMQDSFGPGKPPLTARVSIVAGGIRQRARSSGLTGDSVPRHDRVRAGILLVLVSWTAMVVAGSSFAKMSEHFDTALPNGAGAHHLPDVVCAFIQAVAAVAVLLLIAACALALPALVRYIRAGGWPTLRAHMSRAASCTLVTAAMTAALSVYAHHLSADQRNGGSIPYTMLFLGWAACVVLTLVSWTALAVAAAPRVTFSRSVLAAEAGLAIAVMLGIVAILAATCSWWAVIAERAPAFLSGQHPASPVNVRLVATVALMALAATTAICGAVRISRSLPRWRSNSTP